MPSASSLGALRLTSSRCRFVVQRRVAEGAAMLRTKGEAGTGNVVEAVRHARQVQKEIRMLTTMDEDELFVYAKDIQVRRASRQTTTMAHVVLTW